jgi:flagellar biogenesis protein FliO
MLRTATLSLLLAGALLPTFRLHAQQPAAVHPQPTRWTQAATTIPTAPATPTAAIADNTTHSQAAEFPQLRTSVTDPSADDAESNRTGKFAEPAITVTSSLAVVLGLFAALVWISRKFGSRAIHQGAIPREVLQSLGTTSIDAKTRVTMLRCGNRILIFAQTATGLHPLSEVTDPEEVQHLTATCLGDASRDFVSTLQSIQREPAESGFVGQPPTKPPKRSKLFATA